MFKKQSTTMCVLIQNYNIDIYEAKYYNSYYTFSQGRIIKKTDQHFDFKDLALFSLGPKEIRGSFESTLETDLNLFCLLQIAGCIRDKEWRQAISNTTKIQEKRNQNKQQSIQQTALVSNI